MAAIFPPNLEQTALLEITYKNIDKDAADESLWSSIELLRNQCSLLENRKEFILKY